MPAAGVQVEGLAELRRSFARMSVDLRKELTLELKGLARVVATKAQELARAEGLNDTGQLIKKIKPSVRGSTARIVESAVRTTGKGAPFGYPALQEFGRGRAFMYPAAEAKREEVALGIEAMLDRLAMRSGF